MLCFFFFFYCCYNYYYFLPTCVFPAWCRVVSLQRQCHSFPIDAHSCKDDEQCIDWSILSLLCTSRPIRNCTTPLLTEDDSKIIVSHWPLSLYKQTLIMILFNFIFTLLFCTLFYFFGTLLWNGVVCLAWRQPEPDQPVGDIVSENVFLDISWFKYEALISKFIMCNCAYVSKLFFFLWNICLVTLDKCIIKRSLMHSALLLHLSICK